MLLKASPRAEPAAQRSRFSTLYRVDAIEGVVLYWSLFSSGCFSTLYRVDAIEGQLWKADVDVEKVFQYPLSGRCY